MTSEQKIPKFEPIMVRATERKGGRAALEHLLLQPASARQIAAIPEDRFLSTMTKCINQAGFSWKVIEQKWPEFEEAFFGFKLDTLCLLSDEQWEAYTQDRRVVRSWQKIKALKDNVAWCYEERCAREGIASLIADWPEDDFVGLLAYIKKHGARLGGNSGQRFLRYMGKDAFVLSKDVVTALQGTGLDLKPEPNSQREMKLIQAAFNQWREETGRPLVQLSQILAFSVGENLVGIA
ncbi:MAG: 3-methyladenine DNA glycosylase [Oleiphilus sp.]|nr:MAG: 3-methyladenine DNA glycosylase [Oleiphilus sp.]